MLSGGDASALAPFLGLMTLMLAGAVASIGWNVNRADEGVEPLVGRLRAAASVPEPEPQAAAYGQDHAVANEQPQAQRRPRPQGQRE